MMSPKQKSLTVKTGVLKKLPVTANNLQPVKTILFLGDENLFGFAVEFLLSLEKTCKVVRVARDRNRKRLFRNMHKMNPGVVILYQSKEIRNASLIQRLLQDFSELRVITISSDDNSVQVYNKQRVHVRETADLFSVVEI